MKTQGEILKDLLKRNADKKAESKYIDNYIKDNFIFNSLVNMLIKCFSYKVETIKITVFYFPIPDVLDNDCNEVFRYVILYPNNFYKKGEVHGNEQYFLTKMLEIIDNDIFTLNLIKK